MLAAEEFVMFTCCMWLLLVMNGHEVSVHDLRHEAAHHPVEGEEEGREGRVM